MTYLIIACLAAVVAAVLGLSILQENKQIKRSIGLKQWTKNKKNVR